MVDFEDVSDATWRMIEVIVTSPPLLADCLRVFPWCEDDPARTAAELEHLIRDAELSAQSDERAQVPEGLAACHPLAAIQWPFVRDALAAIRASVVGPGGLDWTETVEQIVSD
ncbi:MAG: hypothetical protein H0X39_03955 [Actinobacteria bacterium]|nr:hypothetical protein [Actinomycetota bacterium]